MEHRSQSESAHAVQGGARQVRMGLGERGQSEAEARPLQDALHRKLQDSAADNYRHQGRRPEHHQANSQTRYVPMLFALYEKKT